MIPTLNVDQANAEDQFVDFLLNPAEKEMKLIGPGGTGKSFLVSQLITRSMVLYRENCQLLGLEPEYEYHALTAMTNKAAQSLQDATGIEVSTIHSWLSLTVRPNFSTGKSDLKRTANWNIKEKFIVFVDEAFMMDPALLDELRMGTMNCKIVYVGDDKQLDPIDVARSPITDLNVRTATLTIPVRNSTSPELQALCEVLRTNVANNVAAAELGLQHTDWPKIQPIPGVIDHIDDAGLQALLHGPLATPNGNNLIVAFSNSRVNDYNNYLRGIRGQSHLFQPGEVLISNDLYERGRFRIRNEATVQIESADPTMSMLQVGDLEVPTQYVRISADPMHLIPVVIDRDFHKEAIKYVQKRAKDKKEDWQRYFQLKNDFADFRPRDACTVHKSQGSTKDLVVIDLTNIGACNFPVMVARMLYVAVSRARYRIILYGQLPAKYGGVIT